MIVDTASMESSEKRLLEREALRNMIQQWNANRLDLFELSEPNENLEFHGVMRFYFQDSGQKIATKCIRVASDATVSDVIETLIEKFRPDMRMLSVGSYSLWETRGPHEERRLEPHEKPLLVQLNWHADDREGRFLLKCTQNGVNNNNNNVDAASFKRKLSKREKKELKKKEKLSRMKSEATEQPPGAEKLYTELPETSFTRSISNPEAVMRRRRQQKLERRLQQFRSKDGGPDTGGTLKIYGLSLCPDVPYKTLLVSIGDSAGAIVREMLDKYGLDRADPANYCIVQVNSADGSETILEDDDCPLAILMTHSQHSSIMFHVRRRPADSQLRRRKKKSVSGPTNTSRRDGSSLHSTEPYLVEISNDGTPLDNATRLRLSDALEVGSGNGAGLQLYGPGIQPRHCVVAPSADGGYCVTPLHTDALVMCDGQPIQHSTPLRHNSVIQFGRAGSFRFVDPSHDSLQHAGNYEQFGSGSMYSLDRSEDASVPVSPVSRHSEAASASQLGASAVDDVMNATGTAEPKDNYETTFDLEGNVETKSVCSGGSTGRAESRLASSIGQEAILPAVLEFPEATQAAFLNAVITTLDPNAPSFKLAPVYTLYLCARYRASTHYRPELSPTERAQKLSALMTHISEMIHATVMERRGEPLASAFWLANGSELLHFLKHDRHIRTYAARAQTQLAYTNTTAFSNLVACLCSELGSALEMFNSRSIDSSMQPSAPLLRTLGTAMLLLRRCRVNAALTIQVFSHLFHYINAVCFNELVRGPPATSAWARELSTRLATVATWAERQGLELAAECHLARVCQAARLLQSDRSNGDNLRRALTACFKLNSLQVRALLCGSTPAPLVEAAVRAAKALGDELASSAADLTLEEPLTLHAPLLVPADGFSAEVVRGVPPGLVDFLTPLQRAGLCRLTPQPHSVGAWTVYMNGYNVPAVTAQIRAPVVQVIRLHKNASGMGLSIVAAKGAGQSKLGIYVKSVVPGGAAAADGRLSAGDQLLSVDGHSLVGITQERAAEYLVRTGPVVTLEVAKQGAVLHGLATLLTQQQGRNRFRSSSESSTTTSESGSSESSPSHHRIPPRPALPIITLTCDSDEESEFNLDIKSDFDIKTDLGDPFIPHICASACACCRRGEYEPPNIPYADESDTEISESRITRTIFLNDDQMKSLPVFTFVHEEKTNVIEKKDMSVQVSPPKIIISVVDEKDNEQVVTDESNGRIVDLCEELSITNDKNESKAGDSPVDGDDWRAEVGATLEAWSRWGLNAPDRWPSWRAEGVKASRSVPALHHIAPNNSAAAGESSRSLSSHNLSEGCYQNLPPAPPRPNRIPQQEMQMGSVHLSHEQIGRVSRASHEALSPHQLRGSIASHEHLQQSRGSVASQELRQDGRGSIASHGGPLSPLGPIQTYNPGLMSPHGPISPQSQMSHGPMSPQSQMSHGPMSPQSQMSHGAMSPQSQMSHGPMSPQSQMSHGPMSPQSQMSHGPMSPHSQMLHGPAVPQSHIAHGLLSPQGHLTQSPITPQTQQDYKRGQTMSPSGFQDVLKNQDYSRSNEHLLRRSYEAYEGVINSNGQTNGGGHNDNPPPVPATRPPVPDIMEPVDESNQTAYAQEERRNDIKQDNDQATPKSILKWRDRESNRDPSDTIDEVAREVAVLRLSNEYSQQQLASSPPPPPERASSFAVMSAVAGRDSVASSRDSTAPQQRDTSRDSVSSRDKRVSFHERQSENTLPSDPDSFLEEAAEQAGSTTHTPGVIGAQEVYRDPRTRRLAEKAARAPAAPAAPDQLSFKEKMKLFALETGEQHTPKDKLKVSRAQRDIDAVH